MSLRASPQTGVAIPRIFREPTRIGTVGFPKHINAFLHRTALRRHRGLPRQCEHWLAMTAYFLDTATTFQQNAKLQFRPSVS